MSLIAKDDPVRTYIDKYKEIAISEMQRTGIPASIKLAQGILESNSGRSTLAIKANNHFGIKCGNYWQGSTFYREDDDYKNGKLIKSCFRKFNDDDISFVAHSDFLTNPGSHYRYGFLFELEPTNYNDWARGLKKSGYATDPRYADKLISIIESYKLYEFDGGNSVDIFEEEAIAQVVLDAERIEHKGRKENRKNYIKSTSFKVENGEHIVKVGESMLTIADKYNIDLDLFYFQNRLPKGAQPKVGEKLKIVGYFHWGEKPNRVVTKKGEDTAMLFEDGSVKITIE